MTSPPVTTSLETDVKYWEAFPDDLKTSHSVTKFKSSEELARAYVSLEKLRGVPQERLLTLPEDMSKPEAMNDVYRALGRPDAPEGYQLSVPDDAPDLAKGFATALPAKLHPLGVSGAAMNAIVDLVNEHAGAAVRAENDQIAADQKVINDFLTAEYGDKADVARAAVVNLLKDAAGDQFEALKAELAGGLGKSPILFKYLLNEAKARGEGGLGVKGDKLGEGLGGIRSVSDARAAKNAFQADAAKMEAWRDATHPRHREAVEELTNINKIIVSGRKN